MLSRTAFNLTSPHRKLRLAATYASADKLPRRAIEDLLRAWGAIYNCGYRFAAQRLSRSDSPPTLGWKSRESDRLLNRGELYLKVCPD